MASKAYTIGIYRQQMDLAHLISASFKILLLKSVGTAGNDPSNVDLETLEALLATTGTAEFDDTNYEAGFGGAGRKDLAYTGTTNQASSVAKDATNDCTKWSFDNVTWAALGGTQSAVAAVVVEVPAGAADDGDLIPWYFFDIANTSTNGADFTLQVGADGAVRGKSA